MAYDREKLDLALYLNIAQCCLNLSPCDQFGALKAAVNTEFPGLEKIVIVQHANKKERGRKIIIIIIIPPIQPPQTQALEIDPKNEKGLYRRACAFQRAGQWQSLSRFNGDLEKLKVREEQMVMQSIPDFFVVSSFLAFTGNRPQQGNERKK